MSLDSSDNSAGTLAALYVLSHDRTAAERLLLPRADKRPAILLDPRLFDAARRTQQMAWLAAHWKPLASQDRPAFRSKPARFLAVHFPT